MSFKDSLKSLTNEVGGGLAAIIMGYDGIAIDEYFSEGAQIDLQLLSVEYANLLRDIRKTVDILANGAMREVAIATELVRVIVRVINEEFFLVLVIESDGNFGKGRYLAMKMAKQLHGELV